MRPLLRVWLLASLLFSSLIFTGQAMAQANEQLTFASHAELTRFQRLTRQFGCVVCHNASLADSDTGLASDLRHEIFQLMRAGTSDERITEDLVDRYSPVLLYQPSAKPSISLLWFAPIGALLLGATVLVVAERRRNGSFDWREDIR